jgi:hypothetical protein
MSGSSAIPNDVGIQKQLTDMHIKDWLQNDVFHFRWWLLIILIAVLFLVWHRMLDKSRMREICLFAVLSAVIFMGVNEYGEELTLWDYPTDLIPIFPPLSSINLLSFPLLYSLVYQHFHQKKSYIYAVVITSAIFCFIAEPLLSWGGFYHLDHWSYFFSFPLYIAVAMGVRVMVIKINDITVKTKSNLSQPGN